MNLDIVEFPEGLDLAVAKTVVAKAGNVLAVQLGSLEFAPTFGVDIRFFLENPVQFQNESFKSYLIERLTQHQIAVTETREVLEALDTRLTFFVDDTDDGGEGLIR